VIVCGVMAVKKKASTRAEKHSISSSAHQFHFVKLVPTEFLQELVPAASWIIVADAGLSVDKTTSSREISNLRRVAPSCDKPRYVLLKSKVA
jgi:hypothetical protein